MGHGHLKQPGFKELLFWALRRRRRFRVEGNSMQPLLSPGDEVLIKPTRAIHEGALMLFRHPYKPNLNLLKLAKTIGGAGIIAESLNTSAGTDDSRTLGPIDKKYILGYITSLWKS